ncbi:MAG: hypothetical protein E7B29_18060, partial [Mixta calida]|nr:hypothetical protein [Mixta calida]
FVTAAAPKAVLVSLAELRQIAGRNGEVNFLHRQHGAHPGLVTSQTRQGASLTDGAPGQTDVTLAPLFS